MEFCLALPLAASFSFGATRSGKLVLGLYLISLGINYVPMLVYAVGITRSQSARVEMGDEFIDKRRVMAKYRRHSMLLLVPLLVPMLALVQELRKAQSDHAGV
ncbi:MAG: hypothetical protein WCE63_05315 [Acidobacteriaceae bacterium]